MLSGTIVQGAPEPLPILPRRHPGHAPKHTPKRRHVVVSDLRADLLHGEAALFEQIACDGDALSLHVVSWQPAGCRLEAALKRTRAHVRVLGQSLDREILGEVRGDVVFDIAPLHSTPASRKSRSFMPPIPAISRSMT
jgi:hypothetical protein